MFHWRSWFLFDLCAPEIYTDFSMHEKNKTESIITKHGSILYIACMRDSSTALGQACFSLFGGFCRQTLPPSNSRAWRLDSHSLPVSIASMPRIRSKGKGT